MTIQLQITNAAQGSLTYSGRRRPFNVIRTGTVTIRFTSDRFTTRTGFRALIYGKILAFQIF